MAFRNSSARENLRRSCAALLGNRSRNARAGDRGTGRACARPKPWCRTAPPRPAGADPPRARRKDAIRSRWKSACRIRSGWLVTIAHRAARRTEVRYRPWSQLDESSGGLSRRPDGFSAEALADRSPHEAQRNAGPSFPDFGFAHPGSLYRAPHCGRSGSVRRAQSSRPDLIKSCIERASTASSSAFARPPWSAFSAVSDLRFARK